MQAEPRIMAMMTALALLVAAVGCGDAEEPALTSVATAVDTRPPTSTSSSSSTTTTAPVPDRVTLAFTGDLLPHDAVVAQARTNGAPAGVPYDFDPMFAQVRAVIARPDLALCHLEVPLSADNALIAGYPSFSSPRELGQAIADAGYDGCSTASNHSLDQRAQGVVSTLDVLDANGLLHSGMARSAAEAADPVLYDTADGVVVGQVSAAYGFNGYVPDEPWRVRDLEPGALIAAGNESRRAGADLVVASLHWGTERQHEITPEQFALADQLTASGAFDLIVGHHAHVVQPVQVLHGVPVIFGLGNFLSNMTDPNTRDGVIARVRATRSAPTEPWQFDIAVTPTWVDPSSFTIRPVAATLRQPEGAVLDGELRASWARTVAVMTADGAAHPTGSLPV